MIVTINQCPTVLFWQEIFNYNLIKILRPLDFCASTVQLRVRIMSGVDVLSFLAETG